MVIHTQITLNIHSDSCIRRHKIYTNFIIALHATKQNWKFLQIHNMLQLSVSEAIRGNSAVRSMRLERQNKYLSYGLRSRLICTPAQINQ